MSAFIASRQKVIVAAFDSLGSRQTSALLYEKSILSPAVGPLPDEQPVRLALAANFRSPPLVTDAALTTNVLEGLALSVRHRSSQCRLCGRS
jgi:hypothetical protein